MAFGKIIRRERERRNLSQREFARLLGVSQQLISLWENAEITPRLDTIQRIMGLLKLDLEQLVAAPSEPPVFDDIDPRLFEIWRKLTPSSRQRLLQIAKILMPHDQRKQTTE